MTQRTPPRRRASDGPQGEYLKFKSPHELSPGERTALAPLTANALDSDDSPQTSQETDDTQPRENAPSNENAAEQEQDTDRSEPTGDASDASSSSDPELAEMLLQAQKMQMEKDAVKPVKKEEQEDPTGPQELRRSRRKRRPVDKLSPPDERSARPPPQKRRAHQIEMVHRLFQGGPAAVAVAAARAEAAKKEQKTQADSSAKRRPTAAKPKKADDDESSPNGVLSPVQDEKKKTPQKKRSRKARRSLEPSYPTEPVYSQDTETKFISELFADLYEEQEQDDRGMYDITKPTVITETSSCKRSQEVQDLSMEEFRRLMTYGEVSVESMSSTILPFLRLGEEDVFFDLGCGTGKILVQAALQTACKCAVGIELMQNRVQEGKKALKRLKEHKMDVLQGKRIEIFRGDMFEPPEEAGLMNATVVFINNVMFGPQLMLKVLALLKDMSKLKRVVTLRKICERHGKEKCERAGNYCVEYVHPPQEAEIDVSWADKTSVYLYENVDYSVNELTRQMASSQAPKLNDRVKKPHSSSSLVARSSITAELDAVA